jgi:carboxypeptidase C (cathepsin A)
MYEVGNATQNINPYDAFGKCYTTPSQLGPQLMTTKFQQFYRTGSEITLSKKYYTAAEYTPFMSKKLVPPCVFAKPVLDYLNNATVRQQLNIPTNVGTWDLCSADINENYDRNPAGSIQVYIDLRGKYRVLKYSGDTDMVVSTYGTKAWIENLNWPVSKPWKQYKVGTQVGGYVELRDNGNFTFATIHGAGHMAPQWRPEFTYHTVFNWINNKPI